MTARYGQVQPTGAEAVAFAREILETDYWRKNPAGVAVSAQDNVFDNRTITTLLHLDKFFGAPGQGPNYDYPNPRAPKQRPLDVYGWIDQNSNFPLPVIIGVPSLAFSSDAAIFAATASDSPSGQNWSGPGYMAKYEIDTTINLFCVFINSMANVPVDPTIVELFVLAPNGAETTYSTLTGGITRNAVGRYRLQFTPSESGVWTYKWQGTGAATATSPDTIFTVAESVFIN